MKPNEQFNISVAELALIEKALLNMISMASNRGDFDTVREITSLMGKIHNQKNWYVPKDGRFQGGG